jgi:hypothetical protein
MPGQVINIQSDLPQVKAGKPFHVTVTLDSVAAADVMVSLEKQRLVPNIGGFPEAHAISVRDYFDQFTGTILVKAGSQSGTSDSIIVKENPQAGAGNPPVHLPEQLLLSGFIAPFSREFRSVLVLVLPFE